MENPEITKNAKKVQALTKQAKMAMRTGNPDDKTERGIAATMRAARLEMALLKWGMVTTIKNEALLQAAQGATQ